MSGGQYANPFIGRIIDGKYRIESLLGRGGFGAVYRATHLMLDYPCAIKIIHAAMLSDPAAVARFEREARATVRINHPNAIAVKDFGITSDQTLYLVMEYFDGMSLRDAIHKFGPIPVGRASEILTAVAGALNAGHERGILHRDVKPDNIMIRFAANGAVEVKVLDFGIAKMMDASSGSGFNTATGSLVGTPQYFSPEQVSGIDLDLRSDVYALGIVTFEMLSGQVPFDASTAIAVALKHVSDPPPDLRERLPNIDPAVAYVVSRALAKSRDDRPRSAIAFAGEFAAAAVGSSTARFAPAAPYDPNSTRFDAALQPGAHAGHAHVHTSPEVAVPTPPTTAMPTPSDAMRAPTRGGSDSLTVPLETPTTPLATHTLPTPQPSGESPQPVARMVSGVTPNAPPAPVVNAVAAPSASSSSTLAAEATPSRGRYKLVAATALLCIVAGATGVAYVATRSRGPAPAPSGAETPKAGPQPAKPSVASPAQPAATAVVPLGDAWLEVYEGTPKKRIVADLGAPVSVAKGALVQLKLRMRSPGYVYILDSAGERVKTQLTASPRAETELSTNAATADTVFAFPGGDSGLDLSEAKTLTVVFSPKPLASPAFLTAPSDHELGTAERTEWATFSGALAHATGAAKSTSTTFSGPDPKSTAQPVAFDVAFRIR